MDSNFIRKDGFSRTETERFFNRLWTPEQLWAVCQANAHCGACIGADSLVDSEPSNLWLLCLQEDSHHYLETVHAGFSCARQIRSELLEEIPCPWIPEEPDAVGSRSTAGNSDQAPSVLTAGSVAAESLNANRVKMDGFSNPDTARHFAEDWTDDWLCKEGADRKLCGFCKCKHILGGAEFVLCLNPDSPYCYETVDSFFTCPAQQAQPEDDSGDESGSPTPRVGPEGQAD